MSKDPLTASPPAIPDASLGGVDDRLWVALERAASRVTAEWRLLSEDAVSAEEAGAGLAHLLGGMLRIAMNEEPDVEALPRSVLGRRLLAVLRRHFVKEARALEQMPDAGQLLTVFACFERLYTYLESDWSKRFAERMGGAGGLELVVEVAHDFRSPLTSILFLAETLKHGRSGPVTPLQERQLGLIYSAAFGLSGVASDVVELARGGDRLVELEPTPFSLADIFESVRDITEPIAVEKGLEIRLVAPESDLRIGHPVALSAYSSTSSAPTPLKFTDEGVVEVGGRRLEGDALEFWVQDLVGIPPASMVSSMSRPAAASVPASMPFRLRPRPSICRKLIEVMKS
ncbi:MAG: HAMP domain-containing sensor histidine kinase [Gemmatimonadales bacterium]